MTDIKDRKPMATMKAYNGWSGEIRTIRGNQLYKEIKSGKYPVTGKCELCDNTKGLTVHSEEYGSTWADFLATCHELCPTCHGYIHVRFRYPNRWNRHKHRLAQGDFKDIYSFDFIGKFFSTIFKYKDIAPYPEVPSGIDWLDAIPMTAWGDQPPKIALKQDKNGILRPDHTIYSPPYTGIKGLRWDHTTGELTEYEYNPQQQGAENE